MTLTINPDQQQIIDQAIQVGIIRSAADVLELGVENLRKRMDQQLPTGNQTSAEDWIRALKAWVHNHPIDTPVLSDYAMSRESMYEDRGL